jgi:hypothetical protein
MIPISRAALYGLLMLNLILSLAVINLYFFANQGKRYTAADGAIEESRRIEGDAVEREERRTADRDIHLRIDNLHPHTWPAP